VSHLILLTRLLSRDYWISPGETAISRSLYSKLDSNDNGNGVNTTEYSDLDSDDVNNIDSMYVCRYVRRYRKLHAIHRLLSIHRQTASCHSIRRYVGRYRDRTMQFIDCNLSANDHRTTPKLFIDWCCERGDPPPRRCAAAARCVCAAADIP